MSIDEFIEKLAECAPEAWWNLDYRGCIIGRELRDEGTLRLSPETFMLRRGRICEWPGAVWAASNNREGHDPALRSRLLAAVGLGKGE